jgi:hypothetical protein
MSKDMTDAELVEAVAREVMGYHEPWKLVISQHGTPRMMHDVIFQTQYFAPLTDVYDLQKVKDKLRGMGWTIRIDITPDRSVYVGILNGEYEFRVWADTEAHAICEAAIKAAKRGEK